MAASLTGTDKPPGEVDLPNLAAAEGVAAGVGGKPVGAVKLPAGGVAPFGHGVAQAQEDQVGAGVGVDAEVVVFGL